MWKTRDPLFVTLSHIKLEAISVDQTDSAHSYGGRPLFCSRIPPYNWRALPQVQMHATSGAADQFAINQAREMNLERVVGAAAVLRTSPELNTALKK